MIRPIIRDLIKNRFYSKEYVSNLPIVSIPPYSNLVTNGDFSNGTTGWIETSVTQTVVNNKNTIVATSDGGVEHKVDQIYNGAIAGHKYFFRCKISNIMVGKAKAMVYNKNSEGGYDGVTGNVVTSNGYSSLIITATTVHSSPTMFLRLQLLDSGSNQVFAGNGESATFEEVECIDLTLLEETSTDLSYLSIKYPFNPNALGGNLQLIARGVDGGSSEQDVDIVGKNLFDDDVFLRHTDNLWVYKIVYLNTSKTYKASYEGNANPTVLLKNIDNSLVWSGASNFSVATNGLYKVYIGDSTFTDNIRPSNIKAQLEYGLATTYEPYNATRLHVQQLNGVGSIKDELYLTDWKLPNISEPIKAGTGTKKCNQIVLQASDITGIETSIPDVYYALVKKPLDSKSYGVYDLGNINIEGYPQGNGIGKSMSDGNQNLILVGFPIDTTLAQAQTALVGKKLTYVLAQYQPINIAPWTYGLIGDLKYRQGGSIVYSLIPPQTTLQYETPY